MAIPPLDELPAGPFRDLVLALHDLYRAAGKPGVRRVSAAIRDRHDMRDTVSHETISAMLRGNGLPRWIKVECVVRQLAEWAINRRDPDQEVRRFHGLWLAADDVAATVAAAPLADPPRGSTAAVAGGARMVPEPGAPSVVPTPSGPWTIANLPGRNPHFTGREALLPRVRDELLRLPWRPLALHGFGGVGKTQLAVEYAHRWAPEYDLVWWVPAEQPSQAVAALAALGERLALPEARDLRQTARAVLDALETSALRWLVLYDNADLPEDLLPLIPTAAGHVIVTSRNSAWATVGGAIEVAVFAREESLGFLRKRGVVGSAEDTNTLAERLGDLPLALAQVGAMQAATGMPVAEYLRLFAEHMDELLAAGRPTGSPTGVTTFVNVAFGRLRAESPAAGQLLEILAFIGAEPVPLSLLRGGRDGDVSPPLGRALHDPGQVQRIVGQIARYGLARLEPDGQRVQVHRLVQLVLRESLDADEATRIRTDVHRLLAAANPGDPDDPRTWSIHAELGPHLVAAGALAARELGARRAVVDQIRYLEQIGDFEASAELGRAALASWRRSTADGGLGPEHELTVLATRRLANALRALGHYRESRYMIVEALERLRRNPQYGEDHPLTLDTATLAAFFLRLTGSYRGALELDQDRVARLSRLRGGKDRRTLAALENLAVNLRLTGDARQALEIDAGLAETQRARLGDDQPATLRSISNQARDLYDLGRYREAFELQLSILPALEQRLGRRGEVLARAVQTVAIALRRLGRYDEALRHATENYQQCQRRFGPDHELTLAAMVTYANALRAIGDAVGARSLAVEAVDRYRRVFGEQNPLTLAAATNLAVTLRTLGRRREAHRVDEVTFDETRRALGPGHPHTLAVAVGLATDLAYNHEYGAARSLGERTFEAYREVRGEDHPETWACAVNLAHDVRAVGEARAADGLLSRATSTLRGLLGDDHPDVAKGGAGARLEVDVEPPPT